VDRRFSNPAFDAVTGRFEGRLRDPSDNPIVIDAAHHSNNAHPVTAGIGEISATAGGSQTLSVVRFKDDEIEIHAGQRDYAAAERFWSPNYIQHSAHIEPGRDGLFNLIKSIPPTLKYEPGVIVAEGDFVIIHGRFSGIGLPVNWIAADIIRMKDGVLLEHWDVIQDEATQEQSKSRNPMFGDSFPNRA
jgi:predicted SnoaL-like aldol condensation-catalyzing enzyme